MIENLLSKTFEKINSIPLHIKILFLVLIIASFLRLYNITQLPPGLYPDEAMNGANIQEALSPNGHFKVFYPENNGREGLFMAVQAIFVVIFGNEPWALRLASAFFGIFTVLGVYLLTKELFRNAPDKPIIIPEEKQGSEEPKKFLKINWGFDKLKTREKIALLSAFLIATSFWHINFSRIGFRAIMAPFFLTWGLYLLLLAFRKLMTQTAVSGLNLNLPILNHQPQPKLIWGLETKTFLAAIFTGIIYGLGFYSYIAYRATPLILFVIFSYWLFNFNEWRKEILKIFIIGIIFSLLVFAPLGYYFKTHPGDFMGRTGQVSVFSSDHPLKDLSINILKTALMFDFSGDSNWRHNYSGRPEVFWPVGIMLVIGIYLGLKSLIKSLIPKKELELPIINPGDQIQSKPFRLENKNYTFAFLVLFSWLFVAGLSVIFSNEGIPHALRSILMISPIFILAGFGGIYFYQNYLSPKFRNNFPIKEKLFNWALIIFFIFLFMEAYNTYFIQWGKNPETLGAFAQNYADIGREINNIPKEIPKYIIVNANGTLVRDIPMPAMTIMFITDSFTAQKQLEKNIHYLLPSQTEQINNIPSNSFVISIE